MAYGLDTLEEMVGGFPELNESVRAIRRDIAVLQAFVHYLAQPGIDAALIEMIARTVACDASKIFAAATRGLFEYNSFSHDDLLPINIMRLIKHTPSIELLARYARTTEALGYEPAGVIPTPDLIHHLFRIYEHVNQREIENYARR
jgi:hypothetical protein